MIGFFVTIRMINNEISKSEMGFSMPVVRIKIRLASGNHSFNSLFVELPSGNSLRIRKY